MSSPVDITVTRSSLEASYRTGRVVRLDRGPIVLRPGSGADLELAITGLSRTAGPLSVVSASGGLSAGGGSGGGGGQTVLQPPDGTISGVDGSVGYDLALLSVPGPLLLTVFLPSGSATTASQVEGLLGAPGGSCVWFSADSASTSSPGSVFDAVGLGSAYVYDTNPLTGSTTGTITDSGTPTLNPDGGGSYICTYVEYTFNGDVYNTIDNGGTPLSPAILFFGTLGGGGSTYDVALYGGDLTAALDGSSENAAAVSVAPADSGPRRILRLTSPEVEIALAGTAARRLSTGQRQAADFSSQANLVRAWMGARNSGGDPDPGYVYAVAPSLAALRALESNPDATGGPIFYAERSVPGLGPLQALFPPGGGDPPSSMQDYDYVFAGSTQNSRGRIYRFGDSNQKALAGVVPAGSIVCVGPAPNTNPYASPFRVVGESFQMITPVIFNFDDPQPMKPYSIVLGDVNGLQPGAVFSSTLGGIEGFNNRFLGFTPKGTPIQAIVSAGKDRSHEILGGSPGPGNAAIKLSGETFMDGELYFDQGHTRTGIGITPVSPNDMRDPDSPAEMRPSHVRIADELAVGAQRYYFEVAQSGVPAKPPVRSQIRVYRQLAYPTAFDVDAGGGAVGPRLTPLILESIDGVPWYIWPTKTGELRISAAYPDWKLAGQVQDETLSDDFSYVSRTTGPAGGVAVPS